LITDGRVLLLQELTARKNRNASYSLRAFARDLGVSPAALSQYLLRKRELSKKNRLQIADRMKLSPLEQKAFESSTKERIEIESHELMSEDTFRLISDWVCIATINLARLSDNQAKPAWISKRLAVSETEAQDALKRLLRLRLIQIKNGRMIRTSRPFVTTTDVPSEAIKKFHMGVLRKAEEALLDLPVEERDITAITMPTDPSKLDEAKKILKRTRRRIADLVSSDDAKEVYVLSIQLFPVSRKLK
jgi:uncharacterized protein (TIGR02147 family)